VNGLGGSGHILALPTANSIMITCQHEWIEQCQIKYRFESLPDGEHWEDAHYPIPECLGGTETVKLWSRDHAVHGFLQSEDLNQVCFHGYRRKTDRALIEVHYPEYLELCNRWFIEAQRRAAYIRNNDPSISRETLKKWKEENKHAHITACSRGGHTTASLGHLEAARNKIDPIKHRKAAINNGRRNVESGLLLSICKEGGKVAGKIAVETGQLRAVTTFESCSLGGKRGSQNTNKQRWIDPDHPELGEHSAATLTQMQKRRGYPHGKENRKRVG
jgi:hypothetical protein